MRLDNMTAEKRALFEEEYELRVRLLEDVIRRVKFPPQSSSKIPPSP